MIAGEDNFDEDKFKVPIKINNSQVCPGCGCRDLRVMESNGALMCFECHREIQSRSIDNTADWRIFDEGGADKIRASKVGKFGESAENAALDKLDNQTYNHGFSNVEKSRHEAKKLITQWGERLKLEFKICERAEELYAKLIDSENVKQQRGLKGRNRRHIVAALVSKACKANNRDITPKQILEVTGVESGDLIKAIMFVNKMLKGTGPDGMKSYNYIKTYCEKLGISSMKGRAENVCRVIVEKSKNNIEGKRPQTIAGAVLYLLCKAQGKAITISEVSKVADCNESTINACYKAIIDPASGLYEQFPNEKEITDFLLKMKSADDKK